MEYKTHCVAVILRPFLPGRKPDQPGEGVNMGKKKPSKPGSANKNVTFVTEYIHKWTKKRMIASDYGYKAWPFGKKI